MQQIFDTDLHPQEQRGTMEGGVSRLKLAWKGKWFRSLSDDCVRLGLQ